LSVETGWPIDLLLTDVVMPESSGFRLAERLQVLRPQIKVVYMSGYADPGGGTVAARFDRNFIQKPFTKETLLRTVRRVLDCKPSAQ